MTTITRNLITYFVRGLIGTSNRHAVAVLVLTVLGTGFGLRYTATHLGINTDTADMISSDLPWRQRYIEYQKLFPTYSDNLLVVIDGATLDLADAALVTLATALGEDSKVIEWVDVPSDSEHFRKNGMLYLDVESLQELSDTLTGVQPFVARLTRDPTVSGFTQVLTDALENQPESLDLDRALGKVADALEAVADGRFYRLSWWELMLAKEADVSDKRRYLSVKPVLDYSDLLPAGPAIAHIRAKAAEFGLTPDRGVRVRITGGLALSHEELGSVSRGMEVAGVSALVMVSIVLIVGLRSFKLVVASLVTLVVGLLWTAWFAAFAIGHLNLISVAFAVLYIGLGVHYAVHFCLRYQELCLAVTEHEQALLQTGDEVGHSLVLCALTTGIGFFAFVPTDFAGVSELGMISGTGMFISLLTTLIVLPALLRVLRAEKQTRPPWPLPAVAERMVASLPRHKNVVLLLTVAVGLPSVWLATGATFDRNPLNLRDPDSESVSTYRDLIADSDTSPWTMVSLASPENAQRLAARLDALDLVDKVVSIADFVPKDQEQKLFLIEDLAFVLALEPPADDGPDVLGEPSEQRAALRALSETLARVAKNDPQASRLRVALDRLEREMSAAGADVAGIMSRVHDTLLEALPGRLLRLTESLQAEPVSLATLPREITERWVSPDGRLRLEIFPVENLEDLAALERFVTAVHSVDPNATDSPMVQLESGNVVVHAFQQAFATALVLITLVLLVLFRSVVDTVLVLFPLLLAGVLTVAATVLFSMPFNFANIITLPLLLGSGVDNGIHLVNRMKVAPPEGSNVLATSTTRAIVVSALTTICSFGNLAHSSHPGTASMGRLLTIGLIMTLICTLIVLPVILSSFKRYGGRRVGA